jgi:hypothetical protein
MPAFLGSSLPGNEHGDFLLAFLASIRRSRRSSETFLDFAQRLPNRLDLLASPDFRVFCYEGESFGQCCRPDESIAEISRIIRRKLGGQHGYFCRDRLDRSSRADFLDKGFHRSGNLQPGVSGQPRQLP